jgi:hypothetical protein
MDDAQRFTGRQITAMVIAICAAVVLVPVGAMAATGSLVNITDPVARSHKARVDTAGRLKVGDGSGALTVDGTVRVASPVTTWYATKLLTSGSTFDVPFVGPTTARIDITSLTVSGSATGDQHVDLKIAQVGSSATNCNTPLSTAIVWQSGQRDIAPITVAFPTPLQLRPTAGHKVCLLADTNGLAQFSASGYYG